MSVIIIIVLVITASVSYLSIRDVQIYRFRMLINRMCSEYAYRHIDEDWKSVWDKFYYKYSYMQMFFSFRPLKLEYWYTEEEINKIKS